MHILLFIVYGLLCGYGIWKIPFFRNCGIRPAGLLLLFTLHVLVGCLHDIIAWRFYPGHGDIWANFQLSFLTRHRLVSDFGLFLSDNSKWTYISHNAILFVHVVLNFFSFDNLYIDTLLFSFPVFLGSTALYRLFTRRFPADPLTAITVFLLPSTLFWTACIHREGVLYMLLGFLFYWLDRLFSQRPSSTSDALSTSPRTRRTLVYACTCFLLIAYFRSAVALTLIPALLAWWLTQRLLPRRQFRALAAAIIVIVLVLLIPGLSLLTSQQNSFLVLEGHSKLPLPALDGSWISLWRVLPRASLNGFLEPLPGSGGQPVYLAFSLELILIWGIIAIALIHRLFLDHPSPPGTPSVSPVSPFPPFSLCCLLFALTGLLLIGTLVPFAGAIVRYRSIYLPFLLAPFLHSLRHLPPFQRLNALLTWLLP